jgi:hypothetical protein
MMTPAQHYAAATRLLTDGVDKYESACEAEGATPNPAHLGYLAQMANAHAILATVPQQQFDAWLAEVETKRAGSHPEPGGYTLHVGAVEDCGHPMCMTAQAEQHPRPADYRRVRPRRPTVLPSSGPACEHGRNAARCDECHAAALPSTICGACSVPCWTPGRMPGSRCDLPGCGGLMIEWRPGGPIARAPIEVRR